MNYFVEEGLFIALDAVVALHRVVLGKNSPIIQWECFLVGGAESRMILDEEVGDRLYDALVKRSETTKLYPIDR